MEIINLISEKMLIYLDSVNWAVAFTCVVVNYILRKGTENIKSAIWFRLVGWVSHFWRAMVVSIAVGILFILLQKDIDKLSVINGIIWSHIIYEGAVKFIKERFGLN